MLAELADLREALLGEDGLAARVEAAGSEDLDERVSAAVEQAVAASEERLTAHIDEAVLALAEALLRRRGGRPSASPVARPPATPPPPAPMPAPEESTADDDADDADDADEADGADEADDVEDEPEETTAEQEPQNYEVAWQTPTSREEPALARPEPTATVAAAPGGVPATDPDPSAIAG